MSDVHTYLEDGVGLWAQWLREELRAGQPAIFLDRDGVIVEEVHFLSRPEDVRLTPGIASAVAAANAADVCVIVVTNQSGIARGHFGWDAFHAVQDEIERQLGAAGATLDAVLGCGYHRNGAAPFEKDHPWRKPGGGMLFRAAEQTGCDLSASFIVGDRITDLEAGKEAGLRGGWLVETGYGKEHVSRLHDRAQHWRESGYRTAVQPTAADAIHACLAEHKP